MSRTDAARERQIRMLAAVAEAGGVVPRARLVRLGHSQRTIAKAIEGEAVISVRRRWVALPTADPFLVAAARSGVVLT